MVHVVLYHSILGLRPVEEDLAREWRDAGHDVTLPDLFDGFRTDDYDAGFARFRELGRDLVAERAMAALDGVPEAAVLAGISMGAGLAGDAWNRRPGAAGILYLAGPGGWPDAEATAPVQLHVARPDPFDDEAYFADWISANPGVPLDVFRYDGAGHLFFDPALPDHDAAAAAACRERCLAFLNGL